MSSSPEYSIRDEPQKRSAIVQKIANTQRRLKMKVRLQEQIRQGVVADKMFKNVQYNVARV